MDRIEFCKKMFLLRKENNLVMRYITVNTGIDESQVRRMENGSSNFSLGRGILYLSALNYKIVISKDNIDKDITSEDEAVSLFPEIREKEKMSYTSFGILLGVEGTHVKNIENKKRCLKIDIFLKMAEKFGYEVSIVKIN